MSEQPYELPPGFCVDGDVLRAPDGRIVANEHLVDGLWWRGDGFRGELVDTHPMMRNPDHRTAPFETHAAYRDSALGTGMYLRRSAFVRSLGLDRETSDRVRGECWILVSRGEVGLYDESAILRLARSLLAKQCDRAQTQLAAIDEAIRARGRGVADED